MPQRLTSCGIFLSVADGEVYSSFKDSTNFRHIDRVFYYQSKGPLLTYTSSWEDNKICSALWDRNTAQAPGQSTNKRRYRPLLKTRFAEAKRVFGVCL